PDGLVAVLAFSPGRGGEPDKRRGEPCGSDHLAKLIASIAPQIAVPVLWFYAENDEYNGPRVQKLWFEAFRAAGGRGELFVAPSFPEARGHGVFPARAGMPLWTAAVAGFFKSQGVALPFSATGPIPETVHSRSAPCIWSGLPTTTCRAISPPSSAAGLRTTCVRRQDARSSRKSRSTRPAFSKSSSTGKRRGRPFRCPTARSFRVCQGTGAGGGTANSAGASAYAGRPELMLFRPTASVTSATRWCRGNGEWAMRPWRCGSCSSVRPPKGYPMSKSPAIHRTWHLNGSSRRTAEYWSKDSSRPRISETRKSCDSGSPSNDRQGQQTDRLCGLPVRAQLLPRRERYLPRLLSIDHGNLRLEQGERPGKRGNLGAVPHALRGAPRPAPQT